MDSQESTPTHHPPQHHIQSLLPHHHQCQKPTPHGHGTMEPPPTQQEQSNSHILSNHNNNDLTRAKVIFHQPQQQYLQFPFNSIFGQNKKFNLDHSSGSTASGLSVEPIKKKRGRPRKYSTDGNIGLGLFSTPIAKIHSMVNPADSGVGGISATTSENASKKGRGRPMGSEKKKQRENLGAIGFGVMPHVIKVGIGEDIVAKIMTFSQQVPRAVCILSACGVVCNATLQQFAMVGGTVKYEGRFEIVSLSGLFLPSESNGSHCRTGGLSVSLAGLDNSIFGGVIAGKLTAGSPVQVVLSSFIKPMSKGASLTPPPNIGAPITKASSPSSGASRHSADEKGGNAQPMHVMLGQTM